jgi:hypothetical protein
LSREVGRHRAKGSVYWPISFFFLRFVTGKGMGMVRIRRGGNGREKTSKERDTK